MTKQRSALLICIAVPVLTGVLSAWLTRGGMAEYAALKKPPFSPPGWVFPVVWTILYILMGIASFLVLSRGKENPKVREGLFFYLLQLCANFLWSFFFFSRKWYLFSFFWIVLLWILIGKTILEFRKVSARAAFLMLPYLLWVTFAGILNLAIARMAI